MPLDVSSWFIEQLALRHNQPVRKFTIGDSDYSERVVRWPIIKRTAFELKLSGQNVALANADGALNAFYESTYTLVTSCTLQFGFTHPTSGDELITVFTGELKGVKYSGTKAEVSMYDTLASLSEKTMAGSSEVNSSVLFTNQHPSDVAWTLVTCYGEKASSVIDSESWNAWDNDFSVNGLTVSCKFEGGDKITKSLRSLGEYTDSAIWIEGDGNMYFKRFTIAGSDDPVITIDDRMDLEIDVNTLKLVNYQHVLYDYSPASDYWQSAATAADNTSVNSYGKREATIKDDTVWFNNLISAVNIADRKVQLLKIPPKSFTVTTAKKFLYRTIGDTVRLVDSFHNVSSDSAWRIMAYEFNMDDATVKYELTGANIAIPFVLDVDSLDSPDKFLT